MRLVESPIDDIAYFALRLVLSGLVAAATAICLRFAWQARRDHWPWRLAGAGGVLLAAAGTLSTYDAIDNVLLPAGRPGDPWRAGFVVLPIRSAATDPGSPADHTAWRERDHLPGGAVTALALTDALTERTGSPRLPGTRRDIDRASAAFRLCPPALIMFDIDHFKATSMMATGTQQATRRCVTWQKVLLLAMRPGDLLGRLGGEEFAVLLYDSTVVAAVSIADRLRAHVRTGVGHPAGAGRQVTVSGGVAPAHGGFESETALSLAR